MALLIFHVMCICALQGMLQIAIYGSLSPLDQVAPTTSGIQFSLSTFDMIIPKDSFSV